MRIDYTPQATRSIVKAPARGDLHHPSLRAKKYDEARDIWQARINDDWRFYFRIVDDTYLVGEIRRHPK